MSGPEADLYAESLAAEIYWAAEQWFRRVDPYYAWRPRWGGLREDHKEPYREMAKQLIEQDTHVSA